MVGEWFARMLGRSKAAVVVPKKVLVSLAEDQMVTGRLLSLKPHGIQVDRVSISNEGKFVALPHPGIAFIPMRRVLMIQYLPDDAAVEVPIVAEPTQGEE